MNALANPPPAEIEAAIEPGYRAILTYVLDHTGLKEPEFRRLPAIEAQNARAMYFWLCDQLKSTGYIAAGFAVGLSPEDAPGEILRMERMRVNEPAWNAVLTEACLVLHCEAVVLIHKGFARAHEPSITAVARKALASPRGAGMVSVDDIQRLAGAYLGLSSGIELRQARAEIVALAAEREGLLNKVGELRALIRSRATHPLEAELMAFIRTGEALDRASPAGEYSARKHHDKSAETLRHAAEKLFGMERKFK
ncbi:MAG: hypothetical protein ACRDBL_09205 [Rhabdaerophilum sp.]